MERAILQAPASQPFEGKSDYTSSFLFLREGAILTAPASSIIPIIVREGAIQLNGSFLHFHITANSTQHAVSTSQSPQKQLTKLRRSLSVNPCHRIPTKSLIQTTPLSHQTKPSTPPKSLIQTTTMSHPPSPSPPAHPKTKHTHQVPLLPPQVPSHHTRLRFPVHAIAPSIAPSHHRSSLAARLLRQGVGVAR